MTNVYDIVARAFARNDGLAEKFTILCIVRRLKDYLSKSLLPKLSVYYEPCVNLD